MKENRLIEFWAHMLDESMNDKTCIIESLDGMTDQVAKLIYKKIDQNKMASDRDLIDMNTSYFLTPRAERDPMYTGPLRICKTPDLANGLPDIIKLSDGTKLRLDKDYTRTSTRIRPEIKNSKLTAGAYCSPSSSGLIELVFIPEDVTLDQLYRLAGIVPLPPASQQNELAAGELCAGYVFHRGAIISVLSLLLQSDADIKRSIQYKINKSKKLEKDFKIKRILNAKFGSINILNTDQSDIISICDAMFSEIHGESVYNKLVKNKKAISSDDFYRQLAETIRDCYHFTLKAEELYYYTLDIGTMLYDKALTLYHS